MTYIETDCTFKHEDREFTSGGAFYNGLHAIGYVGKPVEPSGSMVRALANWHGEQIGTCTLASAWRVHSYLGSHMHQIYATIEGVKYTGRGFGEGMSVNLRRCAKQ